MTFTRKRPAIASLFQFANQNIPVAETGANSAFSQSRVTVDYTPLWMQMINERFDELTSLPKGWDGYDGNPVSFTVAQFAGQLLKRLYTHQLKIPSLVPGGDGSLQIEWHLNGYDIELDVLAPYRVFATRYDCVSHDEDTLELTNDFTQPSSWIKQMLSKRPELAAATV